MRLARRTIPSGYCFPSATMKGTSNNERIEKIGARIKELRIRKGYKSYEDFAHKKNIDRKQAWRMEKGTNLKLVSLFKVVDALDVSLSEFFAEID